MRLEFTLDCSDLDRMAEFWAAAVGFVVEGRIEARYVSLNGHGVRLTLQRVAEPKAVKNRMHIDLLVEDLESEVRRLETLGATRVTLMLARSSGRRGSSSRTRRATSSASPDSRTNRRTSSA